MEAPAARPFAMGEREFVALMALMQALQALAIDVMLPALGTISHELGVNDPNERQLVVGIFLFSSGLASLFPGSLADRFGRRPVALVCVGGYMVFALASALSVNFPMMLAMRALTGVFASGLVVLSATIIRDRFSGDKMARTQSLVAMTFMIVPMAAPTLGQAVLLFAGWRWIFGIMAVLGGAIYVWVFFRLPETLHPEFRQRIDLPAIAGNMRKALTTRASIGYVFSMSLMQGALFGWINSSQQLMAEHFGAGELFPVIFGCMALCMAVTNLANSRIVERFGSRRVSHTAMLGYIALAGTQVFLASGHETIWQFIPIMTAQLCMMPFITSNFQSIALQPFARIAGAAASLQVFLRLVIGSALGSLIGQAYNGSTMPLALSLVVAGISALGLVLYSEKGRLFRRLHGQVPQV